MDGVRVTIEPRKTLGLVFWAWSIAKIGPDGNFHVEVTGLSSHSYKGACYAVEHELDLHYRVLESTS